MKVNLKENGTILFAFHVCLILLSRKFLVAVPRTDLLGENGDCVENLTWGVAGLHTEWGEQR